MDLRTERTRKCITNAFIELRAKKPIEKISIKELSEAALIHKATFYNHYQDIYDLSEQLENELIENILNNIDCFDNIIKAPQKTTQGLSLAMQSHKELIKILFSGSRQGVFIEKLNIQIKNRVYAYFPNYKSNLEFDVALSLLIQGSFYTMSKYGQKEYSQVLEILGNLSETLMNKFK